MSVVCIQTSAGFIAMIASSQEKKKISFFFFSSPEHAKLIELKETNFVEGVNVHSGDQYYTGFVSAQLDLT